MAAGAQVTDLLCEAMEYLTKLGSNLRSRSVSLKEKKIRKDKLRNSHAIQKAAKKVLLICELSKKSLQNVENSMKGILERSDDWQKGIDDGGKTSTADKASCSYSKTITISGKQYTLRIPKHVNLKHFKSVRVMTRSMPFGMMDKYPVYHKCKLYSSRRKNIESEKNKSNENSDIDNNAGRSNKVHVEHMDITSPERSDTEAVVAEENNFSRESDKIKDKTKTKKSSHSEIKTMTNKILSEEENDSESKIDLKIQKGTKNKDSEKQSEDDSSKESDTPKKKVKTDKPNKRRKVIDDSSESEKERSKSKECESEQEDGPVNKSDKSKVIEQGPEKDGGDVTKLLEDTEKKHIVDSDTESNNVNAPNDSSTERNKNDENPVEEQNDTAAVVTKPLIKCVSLDKLLKPEVKPQPVSGEVKENKKTVVLMNSKGELKSKIIDIISPELLERKKQQSKTNSKSIETIPGMSRQLKTDESINKVCKNIVKTVKKVRYQDDEDFWVSKRQEVINFKPKTFSINIHRLPPTFLSDYLYENNLKRITQNGSIVCEVSKSSINEDDVEVHCESNDAVIHTKGSRKEFEGPVQDTVSKAKTALLDDSDVENRSIPDNVADETEKIKKSLLNDSESDEDEAPQKKGTTMKCSVNKAKDKKFENDSSKSQNKAEALKENNENSQTKEKENDESSNENNEDSQSKQDESNESSKVNNEDSESKEKDNDESSKVNDEDSQSQEDKNTEKTPERQIRPSNENQDQELAKSSLLNESSGSLEGTPSNKRKREDSTPQSRRKHIMESMHAKKMLLTYSSSSDTDDEKLKNVIKDIKDSLLKEIGSDEEATKESVKKKLLSTSGSESEEDILKRVRKRKKAEKNKSPSPENDKEAQKSCNESQNSDADLDNDQNNDQSANKQSNSSNSKMGRSREKPGGSSSQNSDTQDDKDIEGLTNLKSLTKSRRRRDSDSDKADSSSTGKKKKEKMSKPPLITGEGLLEAPESSDEHSGAESEGLEEELPTLTLPGLNGSGMDYLAKDDLLGESESDSSKDKSSDAKKDDSDTEAVKARRRKANAISSDSEAGSSRRKEEKGVRVSDFEDSEEESSEPMKRSKRKKKGSDSDASAGSSTEGKKKRRRIKEINDSDASGSDSETEGKSKHGRKNIRKVMGKNQLEEATKKAAREERERLARIVERQKMYNNVDFDESGKPDEVVLDKVVLDFDPDTKEPLIEVDRGLVKKLKPHQANGIKFMWDACFESVKRIKKDKGSGCILAHCMGLGKTLQVVSLTHTLLTHSDLTGVNRVLVVCPLSTVLNWVNEFRMWLKHAERDYEVDVYELSRYKQNSERAFQLSQWFTHGGVCVLGYEMFRNLSADNNKKFKKKMLKQFQESLVDPGPQLVVCDEGHLLKNEKTSLSQSMNRVKTRRRIVLTGTPLQNNLKEYYCMVQFVKPNLLGKYNEYLNRFVNPITNGQYTDSTEHDIRVMKRRSHVLHKMLDGAVQRRDYGVLAPFLPPKHEYVLFITLTEVQIKLYQHYLDNYSRRPLPGKSSGFLFPDFQSLQRIWTHPLVLKYNSERYEIMQQKKRDREEEDSEGSLVDFIDDDSTPDESSTEESSGDLSDMSDDSRKKSKKKKSPKKSKTKDSKGGPRRGTRANPVEQLEDEEPDPDILEVKNDNPTEWWIPLVTEDELDDMRNSHKLVLLLEILRQCEAIGDKLLVFSQSLYSLDLIEHFLGKIDEATQEGRIDEKLGGHVGSWSPGVDYFRLDGSTSCENRSIWCKNFNREDNPRARLFLISTRAGGLGINLVAANRVVIFDVSWNPSHDVQSIFRVYRFGQKKPCYVYRFLAMGTMEEKIYERQVTKQAISKRVIDEQQIDRHYAENDLAELYKFEPRPPAPRPVPLVPKDRLFAEMLKDHEAVVYKFHEHDSLLENKEEETLSEEERKAAWEDFENEKNRPPPAPFPNWPMHNGMVPNLIAQQQQQLAYAALAQMLRKDMPNLSDENIRNMLPIIYGTNPGMFGGYDYGLMQKLSDMYKYAQPGMMNPGMMNPVMNAGGGAGSMGGGGTSGLQYEPPWQRQQQQQQQMRLQQLMQQQNQMGAKFYAGGLGSRDPVAMALQQQRAREIMLGGGAGGGGGGGGAGGAGRPRGRPPLQPRAPPAPADVVNLDSD